MALTVVELENMEFQAFHGCYELEQIVGNRFLVNLRLEADLSKAVKSDSIEDTINYLEVYQLVATQMSITSHILEHVAGRIIDTIYEHFPHVCKVSVKVSKLAPPLGGKIQSVSVTLSK